MFDQEPTRHPYSRVMTIVSWSAAVIGAIAGGLLIALNANEARASAGTKGVVYAPFIFGAIAYLVGMAFSFLFAPTAYLESDSGQAWLDKVGTKTIPSARIVCGVVAGLALALFIAIAVAFINEK